MKVRTSLYINEDLLSQAKERKINLSQLMEKAIRNALNEDKTNEKQAWRACVPLGRKGSNPFLGVFYLIINPLTVILQNRLV